MYFVILTIRFLRTVGVHILRLQKKTKHLVKKTFREYLKNHFCEKPTCHLLYTIISMYTVYHNMTYMYNSNNIYYENCATTFQKDE